MSFLTVLAACSSSSAKPGADGGSSPPTEDIDASADGAIPLSDAAIGADASPGTDAAIDKSGPCASTFGTALTRGFGRVDGTVVAIVQPKDAAAGRCPLPNNDHVIVQVKMEGAVYRMVVNVQSDRAEQDPRVLYLEKSVKLPAPAWAEGWRTGVTLDYVKDFGVSASDFAPFALTELSAKMSDAIPLGAKVSVYSDTSGGSSTHRVHRNDGTKDGAIVLDPDGTNPKALLFRFSTQDF